MISKHTKPTLELLRYSLGGDRPSQTAHLTVSPDRIHGSGSDLKCNKGGISPVTPSRPKPRDQRLPPMLRIQHLGSLSGYSKGSWGLSVLPRDCGIFTTTPISPSLPLRHWSSHYAIHARQNLPDKEFRYLRTVIVTAAVHRGFSSKLRACALTSPFNLPAPGRSQPLYVVLDFAETCVFVKQSPFAFHCGPPRLAPTGATLLPKLRV